jgi:type II secretory pathway component PulJ
MISSLRSKRSRLEICAFTLVEVMVSVTILTGLIFLLFAVVDGTTRVWNQSEQRVDAFREARAALFVIARDLKSAVSAPDAVDEGKTPAASRSRFRKAQRCPRFQLFLRESQYHGSI